MTNKFQQHIDELNKETESLTDDDKKRYRLQAELKGFAQALKMVKEEIRRIVESETNSFSVRDLRTMNNISWYEISEELLKSLLKSIEIEELK